MNSITLSVIPVPLAVCWLPSDSEIPAWALDGAFFAVTHTEDELSIVCEESRVPPDVRTERSLRALKVEGPLDFSLTGLLARLSSCLADAGIPIFAVSTFETDYILVRESMLGAAVDALREAGNVIRV